MEHFKLCGLLFLFNPLLIWGFIMLLYFCLFVCCLYVVVFFVCFWGMYFTLFVPLFFACFFLFRLFVFVLLFFSKYGRMIRLTFYFPYINIIAQSKKCFVFLQFAFPVLTNCNVIYIYINVKVYFPQSLRQQWVTGPRHKHGYRTFNIGGVGILVAGLAKCKYNGASPGGQCRTNRFSTFRELHK